MGLFCGFRLLGRVGAVPHPRLSAAAQRRARISIAAIIEAVDEPISATRCEAGHVGCLAGERCTTHDLWAELGDQIRLFLAGVTLADVLAGQVACRAAAPLPAR